MLWCLHETRDWRWKASLVECWLSSCANRGPKKVEKSTKISWRPMPSYWWRYRSGNNLSNDLQSSVTPAFTALGRGSRKEYGSLRASFRWDVMEAPGVRLRYGNAFDFSTEPMKRRRRNWASNSMYGWFFEVLKHGLSPVPQRNCQLFHLPYSLCGNKQERRAHLLQLTFHNSNKICFIRAVISAN